VTGVSVVAGLCGDNEWGWIIECYSTGSVTGDEAVGGLCAGSGGWVRNSLWDIETSGVTTSSGGIGLSTELMQSMRTYGLNGWAGHAWTIDDGNDYPHLAWENAGGTYISEPTVSLPGSGTEVDPYRISSVDDLIEMSQSSYFWAKHCVLEHDLDLQDVNLTCLGLDRAHGFTGVFDGNDHVIRNLTLVREGSDDIGFFAYIGPGGEVKNLGLEDVNISGDEYVGGLCGYNDGGTISNCYSEGSVSGASTIGGLCGTNGGTINNSYSTGTVTGTQDYVGGVCGTNGGPISDSYSTNSVSGDDKVGGLCGMNYTTIENCYSTGSISGDYEVGGLCGKNDNGTISDSCSTGGVSGRARIGGLCGYVREGTLDNCHSTGTIGGDYDVGGLCGYNDRGTLSNCYSTGSVTGADKYVGGLCGYNKGSWGPTLSGCHSTGNVKGVSYVGGLCGGNGSDTTIRDCYSTGSVSGNEAVGGLCGDNRGSVETSYATGNVTGTGDYIGGLCGYSRGSWDEVSISNCYSRGSVTGVGAVGGLCGRITDCAISNCYSTGSVTGVSDVGGLCGYSGGYRPGTVSSSFWDVNSSGISTSDGGVGADTSLMQRMYLYSFNGWAGQTWTIDDGNDYPHLAWENAGGDYIAEPALVISMEGSGTRADPYQVRSLDDFWQFNAGGGYCWDKHFVLEDDLDAQGAHLLRIGHDPDYSFTGVFDGNGHVIGNLTIDLEDSDYVGLFGYIGYGGKVRNLGLEHVSIKGKDHVGALCGYNHYGTISNCYSTGNVSGNSDVGGLCGCCRRGLITESHSMCSVTGADSNVGGLCGHNNRGLFMNCYARGSVSGDSNVAGLCGRNGGTVRSSYSTGSVAGTGEYVGGFCGRTYRGRVSSSFWDVNTSGTSISDGGLGLTTVEMMDANTFLDAGWDFVDETANGTRDIWHINDGLGYPRLCWERCLEQIELPMRFTPRTVNAGSEGRWIKAHFKLPEGVLPEEVDVNRPAVLEPLGIQSEYIDVFVNKEGLVEVLAAFDRSDFCCSEPIGELVTVERLSFAGQCFYGTDTVRVIDKRLEVIEALGMYWLEACAGPQWCDGSDINADGVVNLHDFALAERYCVEVISE
jgi:hypothetical protein